MMPRLLPTLTTVVLIFLGEILLSQGDVEEASTSNGEIVVALRDSTFEDFIQGNSYVLAEFYAPWCGHCKQLAPEYEQAAKILLDNGSEVKLAKVDATVETELASRFDISGYPTLKFFRNGEAEDYDGPRDANGIAEYVIAKSDPDYKPPPEAVVTLESEEELQEFSRSAPLTLVEFYAPWCGHCKKLAPQYENAAKQLMLNNPPIRLAKMDATVHKEVADQYDVSGFPTLIMFRAKTDDTGNLKVKHYPYAGPRDEHGIVNYMVKNSGEPAKLIHDYKELKANLPLDDIVVVGMFSSDDNNGYMLYQEGVNPVREEYNLFYTPHEDVRKRFKVQGKEAVVVIMPELMVTKYDKPYHVLEVTAETQASDILGFIAGHETTLIGTRTTNNKNRYSRRPLCVLYVPVDWSHEYREMTAAWRDKLLPVANRNQKYFHFAMSDEDQFTADMKSFGFDESGSDFSFGCFGATGEKYPMEELDEWDSDEVEEFLNKVRGGTAKPYLRSQIPPRKQTSPVATVTGRTFKQIVMDETKDVLIELYAPWCGHCKKFEPEYKKLAKQLSSEKNLVIAKMNADANDAPDMYNVQGYPTIYFAPANNKELPIKYEGNRDIDDLKQFLKENSKVAFRSAEKDEL